MKTTRPPWTALLSLARESVALSQERLAYLSGVSLSSVRAYEQGRRHPPRHQLVAMLDAMKVSRAIRNEVLSAAGFAVDLETVPDRALRRVKREEASAEINSCRWPAFLINEHAELLNANTAGKKLWRMEPYGDLVRLGDPVIAVATHPEIVRRIVNWDEAVTRQIAAWKSQQLGQESIDAPSPYFAHVIDKLRVGDPAAVARFVELWDRTAPGFHLKQRWSYRMVWQEPGFGEMRFHCFAWVINDEDGLDIDDWIPEDAQTWVNLDRFLGVARD